MQILQVQNHSCVFIHLCSCTVYHPALRQANRVVKKAKLTIKALCFFWSCTALRLMVKCSGLKAARVLNSSILLGIEIRLTQKTFSAFQSKLAKIVHRLL